MFKLDREQFPFHFYSSFLSSVVCMLVLAFHYSSCLFLFFLGWTSSSPAFPPQHRNSLPLHLPFCVLVVEGRCPAAIPARLDESLPASLSEGVEGDRLPALLKLILRSHSSLLSCLCLVLGLCPSFLSLSIFFLNFSRSFAMVSSAVHSAAPRTL